MIKTQTRILLVVLTVVFVAMLALSMFSAYSASAASEVLFGQYLYSMGESFYDRFYYEPFLSNYIYHVSNYFDYPLPVRVALLNIDSVRSLGSAVVNMPSTGADGDYIVLELCQPVGGNMNTYGFVHKYFVLYNQASYSFYPVLYGTAGQYIKLPVKITCDNNYPTFLDSDYLLYGVSYIKPTYVDSVGLCFGLTFSFISNYSTGSSPDITTVPITFTFSGGYTYSNVLPAVPLSAFDDEWDEFYAYNNLDSLYRCYLQANASSLFAFSDGYNAGRDYGYNEGFIASSYTVNTNSASYTAGVTSGKNEANSTVTKNSASYSAGYSAGVNAAGEYTFSGLLGSVLDVPVNAFREFFNFEVFGVNLTGFLSAMFVIALLVAVLRLVLGG